MRASQFGYPRVIWSLVVLCVAMWGAPADAQPAVVVEATLPSSTRTTVAIDGHSHELVRRDLSFRSPLSASAAFGPAESAAPQPKQRDSLLNGVLIGAGIGALLGLIPDYYDDCEECHDSLYASIAVGAGIGLVVDLLRSDRNAIALAVRAALQP